MRTAALFVLVACGSPASEPVDDPTPVCDGVRQALEETTDAPFDRDGDGFFDGNDPGCASAWQPNQLDCDDDDPDINPAAFEYPCDGADNDCRSATPDNRDADNDGFGVCDECDDADPGTFPGAVETCFDGIDDDCDGITDNDCGDDYNGTWQLDDDVIDVLCDPIPFIPPLVDIDFDQFDVYWAPPSLSIVPLKSVMPTNLDGSANPQDGSFHVEFVVGALQFGICQERYYLDGTFTSDTTLEAVFSFEFEPGSPGSCAGCAQSQSLEITATEALIAAPVPAEP